MLTKQCSRCLREALILEYQWKDGRSTGARCRLCRNELLRAWRQRPVGQSAIAGYVRTPKHKEAQKVWIQRNPEKHRVHMLMSAARRKGLINPLPCEVCGNPKSESHHEDYSKPLEVVWLCAQHHKQADARRRAKL